MAVAGNLKKVSLELGGKSPNVVYADAELDAAIPGAANAIFFNHRQCCNARGRGCMSRSRASMTWSRRLQGIRLGPRDGLPGPEQLPRDQVGRHSPLSGATDDYISPGLGSAARPGGAKARIHPAAPSRTAAPLGPRDDPRSPQSVDRRDRRSSTASGLVGRAARGRGGRASASGCASIRDGRAAPASRRTSAPGAKRSNQRA